ncbi:O-antigen biosynthesis protein [Candidatus Magnetomoraceae bacterium gMMP-1]
MKCSVIIPVFNQIDFTKQCLKAILQNTPIDLYEIIIVDNASTDGTKEFLNTLKLPVKIIRNFENKGYAIACNQGAKAAIGKYLIFLNNDTIPQKGWLESSIKMAESDPSIGAIGAKLIYPDGVLQEAGGIIFSDGTSLNIGAGDNPDKDIYNKIREVHYCSGACLFVRRDLFNKIRGFDLRYAPAYCEDSDLCFSIRKLGYKIMYNPNSVVFHYEAITSRHSIDGNAREKIIMKNKERFIKKWKKELDKQPISYNQAVFLPVVSSSRQNRLKQLLNEIESNLQRGNKERAIKIFLKIMEKWPNYDKTGCKETEQFLRQVFALKGDMSMNIFSNKPNSLFDMAIQEYQKGNIKQAEALCNRFLNQAPDSASAVYLSGLLFQKLGNNETAIDRINKAISINAIEVAAFQKKLNSFSNLNPIDRAVQEYQTGNMNQAEALCSEILRQDPDNASILYLSGLVLQKIGRYDESIEYINKGIAANAVEIAEFQKKLNITLKSNADIQPVTGFIPEEKISPLPTQAAPGFEATRNLLNRIENKEKSPSERLNNLVDSLNKQDQPTIFSKQDQPIVLPKEDQPVTFPEDVNLYESLRYIHSNSFFSTVLLWPEVNLSNLSSLSSLSGLKLFMKYDAFSSYSEPLADMERVTNEQIRERLWDALVLPFSQLREEGIDNILSLVNFSKLIITDGLLSSPETQDWDEAFKALGLEQDINCSGVYAWKDKNLWGEFLFAENRLREAIQCFNKIVEEEPTNISAFNNLGVIAHKLSQMESAEKFFLEALSFDPNHLNAHMNLADVYMESGHFEEASRHLKQAMQINDKDPSLWESLGNYYQKMGRISDATQAFNRMDELLRYD